METTAVLVMAKAPRPGLAKTRLEPLLGPAGCARLQELLIAHAVSLAREVAPDATFVAFDPPDAHAEIAALAGEVTMALAQEGANLGERMSNATKHVFSVSSRWRRLLIIGTDAPSLDTNLLRQAAKALGSGHDLVFGPALDGGYWLVGMNGPLTEIFEIDPRLWGGQKVLSASMQQAEDNGLRVFLLPHVRDLDDAEDAAFFRNDPLVPQEIRAALAPEPRSRVQTREPRPRAQEPEPRVSIVVPTLNEAPIIEEALLRIRRDFPGCELIVADGGSTDGTVESAGRNARVVSSPAGRAQQMNAGAAQCSGDVLWFVHADSVVDPGALAQLRTTMRDDEVVGGGLSLRFDQRSAALDYLAFSSNLRARHLHQVFGDQAMFVRRSVFEELGGFPEISILEDLEMSRRLHRRGRLVVVDATSTSSARRIVANGTIRMIVFMQYLKVLYFLGIHPDEIRRRYANGPPSVARAAKHMFCMSDRQICKPERQRRP